MKKCPWCGKEYPDEAVVCAIDRQPLQPSQPLPPANPAPAVFPISDQQSTIDREHLKLLSIFHFIVAGLNLLGLGFLFLHYLIMSSVFSNQGIWKSTWNASRPPQEVYKIFAWIYVFMGLVLVAAGTLNLLSGLFLRNRTNRLFSLVVAVLNCLQIPFGTILGAFTIIVLVRDSVRRSYETRVLN